MIVRELMTPHPLTISPEQRLDDALELMHSNDVRELPVVDAGRLVGILTDRDVKTALGREGRYLFDEGADPGTPSEQLLAALELAQPVGEAMTAEVQCVYDHTNASEACQHLNALKIGSLPVVDSDHELVGILSVTDLLAAAVPLFALSEVG